MPKLSKDGLNLIKSFEGLRLKAYKCDASEKYYTIGYGHYSKDVKPTDTITESEAEKLLISDMRRYEKNVNDIMREYAKCKIYFNQAQYDALVSFAYNIGSINQLTANATRSKIEIANKLLLYDKCGGKVLKGLQNRRRKEYNLFTSVKGWEL